MFHTELLAGFVDRPTDLLRLVAIPAFAWASWRDIEIRRVPNRLWPPLLVLGAALLAVDARYYHAVGGLEWQRFLIGAGISVGVVVPLVYAFWLLGGFGGADVKALATLAVLYPTFPTYFVGTRALPLVDTHANAFAFTILTNAVVVGLAYPLALAAFNGVRGDVSPWMLLGRRYRWDQLPAVHGRILETPEGFTRSGLDVDALRMYLRWRGIELAALRERTDELRDPASLPAEPNPPTDGAVATDGGTVERADGGTVERTDGEAATDDTDDETDASSVEGGESDDPWGAAAFLDDVEGSAYGTDVENLRETLELVAERDAIWVSPGIPFIVPVFVGLLVALTYGDVLFGLMQQFGLV